MKTRLPGSWVVYRMAIKGKPDGVNAVCEQTEWDVMEASRPGFHTLIESGIANEAEAERLARGTSGDSKPRSQRPGIPLTLAESPIEAPTAAQ